jgi:hypothetical protein
MALCKFWQYLVGLAAGRRGEIMLEFKWWHLEGEIVLRAVRWYCRLIYNG